MISRQGRSGKPGDRGPRGPRGDKGDKGDPGPTMLSWQIDRSKYRASPLWGDGKVGPNLELHGLYEQFQQDTGND